MAETELFKSLQPKPPPPSRKGWRWRTRIALGILAFGATLVVLLAGVIARPWVLVLPVNWLLAGQPIKITVSDARLEIPFGLTAWRKWRWHITDFALISHKQGTPTLMADVVYLRMPALAKSWEEKSIVIPKAGAIGFTVFIPESKPPPPFEEVDGWPLRALVIDQAVLLDFQLVMRDASGMPIIMDEVDGQISDFKYDFGHRKMYGTGYCQGATLGVGPLTATNLHAVPIEFAGTTMVAKGYGSVRHQRAKVLFAIDGLFRPAAAIHAEFEIEGANVRALLVEAMGEDAPDMDGKLSARAVIDSKPPNATIDVTFRLVDAEIQLPEETKAIIIAALKVAPFVEVKDRLVRLGPLSGRVSVKDGAITLSEGRYEADNSAAQVDGRMTRTSLRGRVHFVPTIGSAGLNWGLLLSGTAKHPKIQLADPAVLEAWTLDGEETTEELREGVKDARVDLREMKRESRKAQHEGRESRRGHKGQPVPVDDEAATDGSAPPLTGPVEKLP